MTAGHYWSDCPMCGPMVVCGTCGNNCCNGGYGILPNGVICGDCPAAYKKQGAEYAQRIEAEGGNAKTGSVREDESRVGSADAQ